MTAFYIVLIVAIILSMAYLVREIDKKYLVLDAGKFPIFLLIMIPVVMFITGICSGVLYKNLTAAPAEVVEEVTAEQICEENSLSYTLVQTIAEYTNKPELELAYVIKYCSESNMDLDDAVALCDASLTKDEVNAILIFSDNRQEQADKAEAATPAETTEE